MAPDGRSLVTSVGTRRSAIWIHDAAGERAIVVGRLRRRLPAFPGMAHACSISLCGTGCYRDWAGRGGRVPPMRIVLQLP